MNAIDRFASDRVSTAVDAFAWDEHDWGDGHDEISPVEALFWRPNDGLEVSQDEFAWLAPAAPGDGVDVEVPPLAARDVADGVEPGAFAASAPTGFFLGADGIDSDAAWRAADANAFDEGDGIDDADGIGGIDEPVWAGRDASFDGADWGADLPLAVPHDGLDSVAFSDWDGAPTSA